MTTILLCACGGSGPPPKTEEVPIGTESAKREAKRPDPEVGEDVTQGTHAAPAAASPPASEPSAPAAPSPPATAGKAGSSKTSKGGAAASSGSSGGSGGARTGKGELSKAECDQLMDRYIDVVVTGDGAPLKGMSGKELEQARGMIKATVSQDPNFVGFKTACYRDLSKAQFACAMKARATEEFQNCIR